MWREATAPAQADNCDQWIDGALCWERSVIT